uniref:hypothetical protein n=1 Tax=Roseovarius sp. BRH_c41 TaxID=1629709 RepID=UPI000A6936EC|nr:hypothetical protein [Roseovarius sp. BRH_c41]
MAGPEGAFLIGKPAAVVDKILFASETLGGVSRINFQMSTGAQDAAAMMRSIELLDSEVAPTVRQRLQNGPT